MEISKLFKLPNHIELQDIMLETLKLSSNKNIDILSLILDCHDNRFTFDANQHGYLTHFTIHQLEKHEILVDAVTGENNSWKDCEEAWNIILDMVDKCCLSKAMQHL